MAVQFNVFFEILLKSFKRDDMKEGKSKPANSVRNAFSLYCPRITFYSTYTFSSPLICCLPSFVAFIFGLLLFGSLTLSFSCHPLIGLYPFLFPVHLPNSLSLLSSHFLPASDQFHQPEKANYVPLMTFIILALVQCFTTGLLAMTYTCTHSQVGTSK